MQRHRKSWKKKGRRKKEAAGEELTASELRAGTKEGKKDKHRENTGSGIQTSI